MKDSEALQKIAEHIEMNTPDGSVFILFCGMAGVDQRVRYISNMDRETVLNVIQEFLLKHKDPDKWMKHNN